MTNRERIALLEEERDAEIGRIEGQYFPLLNLLHHKFTIEELESAGWKRMYINMAMSNPYTHDTVYDYKKNGKTIIVHTNPVQVRKYGATSPTVCDWEELNSISGE